jgi:sulfur carrier protein ThiS adenylyltransferase
MLMDANERFSRQQDLVPIERLAACRATVVGVGAIGRQVALQLAAMGLPWLQLVDFDLVEMSNLASQGYLEKDLSWPKVTATAKLCREIDRRLEVLEVQDRFRRGMETGDVLFCCVDSIEIRRIIWKAVEMKVKFFVDGRMSAEVVRVLAVGDPAGRKRYSETLFPQAEAYGGSCTARTTIYAANVAAGLMIAQFAKWLRRLPVELDVQMNLLTAELIVS